MVYFDTTRHLLLPARKSAATTTTASAMQEPVDLHVVTCNITITLFLATIENIETVVKVLKSVVTQDKVVDKNEKS